MLKSLFVTTALVMGIGAAVAQDSRVAPGTPAPNTPRAESDGSKSPAPSQTVTGGVGANENSGGKQGQTISGGPSGGKGNGGGGS